MVSGDNPFENPGGRPAAATELLYPDGNPGDVKAGFPSEPSARSVDGSTGIPAPRSSPDDVSSSARKTLGEWLHTNTSKNITPVPGAGASNDATPTVAVLDDDKAFDANITHPYLYSQEPEGADPGRPTLGPTGDANTLLRDAYIGTVEGSNMGPKQDDNLLTVTTVGNPSVILSRNRFQPNHSYGEQRKNVRNNPDPSDVAWSDTQKFSGRGDSATPASTIGKYLKGIKGLSMEELQLVADQLLLNAVGDKKTSLTSPTAKGDAATEFGGGVVGAQLGRGRANDSGVLNADLDFRAAKAIVSATGGPRGSTENPNGQLANLLEDMATEDLAANKDYVRKSYGVLNNHLEYFANSLPTSMILLALIAALTMIIAALVLSLTLDILGMAMMIGGGEPSFRPTATYQDWRNPQKMGKGAAFGNDDFGNTDFFSGIYKWLELPALEAEYNSTFSNLFPFTTAATVGSLEFFIGNSFSRVAMPQIGTISAGYYVVVVRNALRDLDQISDAAEEMGGGGFINAIEGFFGLIDAFTSSATFRFLRTVIQLGDRLLCGGALWFHHLDNNGRRLPAVLPEHERRPKFVKDLGSSIRINPGSNRLSYCFSALPQLFLRPKPVGFTPANVAGAGSEMYLTLAGVGRPTVETSISGISVASLQNGEKGLQNQNWSNGLSYSQSGRISTTFREAVEAELDAYYVPFYFHDMRTNEILPLPCFVSSFSDSFSPKYQSQGAFGRTDDVQIYQTTQRKIGLTFYMVATSPDDFSQLYIGINKLVSMVYPQWGGGRRIVNGRGESFQAPYSYVMTASPMIRMRVGDLFHSNRTAQGVRQLFGGNQDFFRVPQNAASSDAEQMAANAEAWELVAQVQTGFKNAAVEATRHPGIDAGAYDLIMATNIMNPSGVISPPFGLNLAGGKIVASPEGVGDKLTGGVQSGGVSLLVPHGTHISVKQGKYAGASWNGVKFKAKHYNSLTNDNNAVYGVVVNYAVKGGKKLDKDGYLKNQLYYVVAPPTVKPGFQDSDRFTKATPLNLDDLLEADQNKKQNIVGILVPINNDMDMFNMCRPHIKWSTTVNDVTTTLPMLRPPDGICGAAYLAAQPPALPGLPVDGTTEFSPLDAMTNEQKFFENNPVIQSMRDSGGKGLAGFINSLDFDWNEAPWETDPTIGQAPQWCKVSIGFTPIHDEPLGLNNDGSMRAAAYPVGAGVKEIVGSYGVTELHQFDLTQRYVSIQNGQTALVRGLNIPGSGEEPPNPQAELSE